MANQHTKKASPAAKKEVGKPAVKAAPSKPTNEVGAILADFKSRLGKDVEYHWYNSEVLPLQQRFDGGEVSESLTVAALALKHP